VICADPYESPPMGGPKGRGLRLRFDSTSYRYLMPAATFSWAVWVIWWVISI
jgi:hypothetical protein